MSSMTEEFIVIYLLKTFGNDQRFISLQNKVLMRVVLMIVLCWDSKERFLLRWKGVSCKRLSFLYFPTTQVSRRYIKILPFFWAYYFLFITMCPLRVFESSLLLQRVVAGELIK